MSERTNSKIFGIIGESLSHTLSPQIHNHFFKKLGLNYSYHIFPLKEEKLKEAFEGIKALGIKGVNVTFPFKEKVIPYLDKLEKQAEKVGAVNTIINNNGKLIGYNTDVFGVHETIEQKLKLNLNKKSVMILGAGGAARACLWELLKQKPERILVLNRTFGNAEKMVAGFSNLARNTEIKVKPLDQIEDLDFREKLTLLINATSAPFSLLDRILQNLLRKKSLANAKIFDLNYSENSLPGKTFTDRYTDGLYMLASQAAGSFYIWTKIKLNPQEVYNYIRKKVNKR